MLTAICTFQIRISDTFSRLLRWLYNMHRNMNIDRIHSIIEINPLKKSQQIKFEMLKGRIRLVLTMSKSIVANVMHKWPEKKRETKINYFAIQWNVQFWNEKKNGGIHHHFYQLLYADNPCIYKLIYSTKMKRVKPRNFFAKQKLLHSVATFE